MATTFREDLETRGYFTQFLRLADLVAPTGLATAIDLGSGAESFCLPTDGGVRTFAQRIGYAGTDPAEALDFIIATAAALSPLDPLAPLRDLFLGALSAEQMNPDLVTAPGWTGTMLDGSELSFAGGSFVDGATGMTDAVALYYVKATYGATDAENLVYLDSFIVSDAWDWANPPPPLNHITGTSGSDFIKGTGGNDLIEAFGGSDEVKGGAGNDQVYGNGGHDTLRGAAGDDFLSGGSGNDDLRGDDGNDTLMGGTQNDRMNGGAGDDYLDGEAGDDRLKGADGNDTMRGDNGSDVLLGGTGDDLMDGGAGEDALFGEDGNDTMSGGEDNDQLSGGLGDDVLSGGWGVDDLMGGAGADRLQGDWGDDILTGGADTDIFVFTPNGGTDFVVDFEDGLDLLDISALGLGWTDLTIEEAGGATRISAVADADFGITLAGVTLAQIDAGDFIFAV